METILIVLHLLLSLGLVALILLQHGKGADAGAAFGSGASATVFGARGAASFLSRTTAILAALFFLTSMALAYFATQATDAPGLMEDVQAPLPASADALPVESEEIPVVPASENTDSVPVPAPVPEPGSGGPLEGQPAAESGAEATPAVAAPATDAP